MTLDTFLLALLNVLIGVIASASLYLLGRLFTKIDHIDRTLSGFGERLATVETRVKVQDELRPGRKTDLQAS